MFEVPPRYGLLLVLTIAASSTFALEPPDLVPESGLRNLTSSPSSDRYPVWSPDGKRIAFESDRSGSWNLWLMDVDGSNPEPLTVGTDSNRQPSWDPEGKRLVFQSDRTGSPELHILHLDSGAVSRLTDLAGTELFPSWSPDGSTVAFSLEVDGAIDIYTIASDGTHLRTRFATPQRDVWPRWSPDGRRLAFFSRFETNGEHDEIYLLDVETDSPIRLTDRPGHDFCPAWSPDGTRIAMSVSRQGEPRRIRILDLDGRERSTFGSGFTRITEPSWSPDGESVAVAGRGTEESNYDIFVWKLAP